MPDSVIIPAASGFKVRFPKDSDWCDVIAWRLAANGRQARPISLWCVYGDYDEPFMIKSPDGVEELVEP